MKKQKKAYVCALIAVLCWSTVASAFKLSLRYVDFLHLLLFASLVSALSLFIIVLIQGKLHMLKTYSPGDYAHSALMGFLNPYLYYLVLFKAYSLIPAQQAQPLNYTWPIMLVLLSIPLLKQKIGFRSICALFTSFAGVVIIATSGDVMSFRVATNPFGVFLALGSSVVWALFWIFNIRDSRDDVVKLFLSFSFGFLYTAVTVPLVSNMQIPGIKGILGAIYVAEFEMGITFVIWLKALKLSGTTTQVSNIIYAAPFLSLVVIHFVVGETILFSTFIGLVFIVTGILLQHYRGRG